MSVPLSRLSVRSLPNFVRLTTSPLRQNVPPPAFHFAAKNFDCKSFSTSNGLRCVKEGETQPGKMFYSQSNNGLMCKTFIYDSFSNRISKIIS